MEGSVYIGRHGRHGIAGPKKREERQYTLDYISVED